jgi:hypothetical protein
MGSARQPSTLCPPGGEVRDTGSAARDGPNDELRDRLWSDFSGPAVALFTCTQAHAFEDGECDARAVLAMTAGAALFLTTVAA